MYADRKISLGPGLDKYAKKRYTLYRPEVIYIGFRSDKNERVGVATAMTTGASKRLDSKDDEQCCGSAVTRFDPAFLVISRVKGIFLRLKPFPHTDHGGRSVTPTPNIKRNINFLHTSSSETEKENFLCSRSPALKAHLGAYIGVIFGSMASLK
ncbi:hypothetical protein ACH5RR_000949 [Cinchona calisaya]|uniref:Uncharacterized protein n=1 Tax=Cinchona calisaya TaxID=153742 RepID=A0ABD3B2N6_9GENT